MVWVLCHPTYKLQHPHLILHRKCSCPTHHVGQEHHENVDIVHDWFHSLKLFNLINCSLGSHEKHGNEKCGCEEEHTETGKSLFTLFRVITLHGPIERSRTTDETHDGVNKRK